MIGTFLSMCVHFIYLRVIALIQTIRRTWKSFFPSYELKRECYNIAVYLYIFSFAEIDQNKDRMLEILEGKGLSFLFPLLKLEKELLKQIKLDPSPQAIYKWIKDNISPKLHVDKGFVNILMTR